MLWLGVVILLDNPYIFKCIPSQKSQDAGPRGPYLDIKGLLFHSIQGSHLALVQCGDRY